MSPAADDTGVRAACFGPGGFDPGAPPARGDRPVTRLRSTVYASLLTSAPDGGEQRRPLRRTAVGGTLLAGAIVLVLTLRIEPGDPSFYAATLALAFVWGVGGLASGPPRLGSVGNRPGWWRPIIPALLVGTLAAAVCLVAAPLVAQLPVLRDPVDDLLNHAQHGAFAVVLASTALNGVAEEIYFRGALYAALPSHAVAITTVVYTLTAVGSGVPLLVAAAAMLGLLTGLQRRTTGGVLAPIVTHLTWSIGMFVLLPPVLDLAR